MRWGSEESGKGVMVGEDGDGVFGRCERSVENQFMDCVFKVMRSTLCFLMPQLLCRQSVRQLHNQYYTNVVTHTCTGVSMTGISELITAAMFLSSLHQSKEVRE